MAVLVEHFEGRGGAITTSNDVVPLFRPKDSDRIWYVVYALWYYGRDEEYQDYEVLWDLYAQPALAFARAERWATQERYDPITLIWDGTYPELGIPVTATFVNPYFKDVQDMLQIEARKVYLV